MKGGTDSKNPLYVHYPEVVVGPAPGQAADSQRIAKLEEQLAELPQLKAEVALLRTVQYNTRMKAFTSNPGEGAAPFTPSVKQQVRDLYSDQCAFCGRRDNLSVAHLANRDKSFNTSRKMQRFREPFVLNHVRNAILLCHDGVSSCHAQFDAFNLALMPGVLGTSWQLVSFSDKWHLHGKTTDHNGKNYIKPFFDFQTDTLYKRVAGERLETTLVRQGNGNIRWYEHCAVVVGLSVCKSDVEDAPPAKRSRTGAMSSNASA